MKYYILLFFSLGVALTSFGQNQATLPNPVTGLNDRVSNISTDFGPRDVPGSRFHKGVDYDHGDAGQPAYAVEGGDITLSGSSNQDGSKITVGNFRYRHLLVGQFRDPTGQYILWDLQITNDYQLLIIRDIYPYRVVHIYGTNYPSNEYFDRLTYETVPVETSANQGALIFRANHYSNGPHLHLERVNTRENPLAYLHSVSDVAPTVLLRLKHNLSNVATEFNGSVVYGNIIVESEENTTVDMDFDHMEVNLIKDGATEQLNAWNYTGDNQMEYDGYDNNVAGISPQVRNTIRFKEGGHGYTRQEILDDIREGVYPLIHTQSNTFFKLNFDSQTVSPTSTLACGYKYCDGSYTFRTTGTDVGNNSTPSELVKIIDNTRPYVKAVTVKSDNVDVYKGEWVWNKATEALEYVPNGKGDTRNPVDGIIANAERGKKITIVATASEPLASLQILTIAPLSTGTQIAVNYPIQGIAVGTSQTEWEFTIDASAIKTDGSTDGIHFIRFTGTDLAGNSLECFSPSKPTYAKSEIPKRVAETTWTPAPNIAQGYDDMHCFKIEGVGGATQPEGDTPLSISISASANQVEVNSSVSFSAVISDPNAVPDDYSYEWVFKNGNTIIKTLTGGKTISTSFSSSLIVTAEVTLKKNGTIAGFGVNKGVVVVGPLFQPEIVISNDVVAVNEEVNIEAKAIGSVGASIYTWTFDGSCSKYYSTNQKETISYSTPGVKTIKLEITSNGIEKTVEKQITVSATPPLQAFFNLYFDDQVIKPNRQVQFYSEVQNAKGIVNYYWDFGDNSDPFDPQRRSMYPFHEYTNRGTYTVTLHVVAENGSVTIAHNFLVSNVENVDAKFTATPAVDAPSVSFKLSCSTYEQVILYFDDGTCSNITSVGPTLSPTIVHQYSNTQFVTEKTALLKVAYLGKWEEVYSQSFLVQHYPTTPNALIEFADVPNMPYISACIIGLVPHNTPVGHIGANTPCDEGDAYYYHVSYSFLHDNHNVNLAQSGGPCFYLDLNNSEIQEHFRQNLPFTFRCKLHVVDATERSYQDEREITLYPQITTDLKSEYTACNGTKITLAPIVTGGSPPYEFFWRKDGVEIAYSPTLTVDVNEAVVDYELGIRDSRKDYSWNDDYYTKKISVKSSPVVVDAGNTVTLCSMADKSTFHASVVGGGGNYVYRWSPITNISSTMELNPTVAATKIGAMNYTLKVTDQYGCSASDIVAVNVYEPIDIKLKQTYYVDGDESVSITPVISGGSGNFSYKWSTGATTKDISVNFESNPKLVFTVTDNVSGCSQEASCTVVSISSSINISPNSIIRGRHSYTITIPVTSTPGNVSYTAATDCPWVTITDGSSGYTGDFIVVNIAENNTSAIRNGKIIIQSPEALNSPYEIAVTQTTADVLRVPTEYGTIQAAINAAEDGDKVEVDEGLYLENIVFLGDKKISVKGVGCIENTIIKAVDHTKSIVLFDNSSSILQGFTITGNHISNTNSNVYAGGITIRAQSNPKLYDLLVSDNMGTGGGGGIRVTDSDLEIVNVKVVNNKAEWGGGIEVWNSNALLQNVLIMGNEAKTTLFDDGYVLPGTLCNGRGGGLDCEVNSNVTLDNVTIYSNLFPSITSNQFGELSIDSGELNVKNSIINGVVGSLGGKLNATYSYITGNIKGTVVVSKGIGVISLNPQLSSNGDLISGSPCINAGDPLKPDRDNSRCDMGYTGGKGIYNKTVQVCTKDSLSGILPMTLIAGGCTQPLMYGSGETGNFISNKEIIIKPGFQAGLGSSLNFKIQPDYNMPFLYDDKCKSESYPEKPFDKPEVNDELKNKVDFFVFPNPSDGIYFLELLNFDEGSKTIELVNLWGVVLNKMTTESKITTLDYSQIQDGVYLLKITNGSRCVSKMLVKIRD